MRILRLLFCPYLESWWMPAALSTVLCVAWCAQDQFLGNQLMTVSLMVSVMLSVIGGLIAIGTQFARKSWKKGLLTSLLLFSPVIVLLLLLAMVFELALVFLCVLR